MQTDTDSRAEFTGLLPDLWRNFGRLPALVRERAVTLATCLAAIGLSIESWMADDTARWVVRVSAFANEPWRLATSILLHANVLHLVMNLSWMWPFGQLIERRFGSLKTAALFAFVGVGSSCAQYALSGGGIGLSGVVYGLFGFLWVLNRREPRFRGILDARMIRTFVVWFFVCIALTATNVLQIGNAAHASGCVLGALAAMWTSTRAATWGATTIASSALCIAGATWLRPYVNATPWYEWNERGHELYTQGEYREAAALFRRSLKCDEEQAYAWNALGNCLQRMEEWHDAGAAYDRAHELVPTEGAYERNVLNIGAYLAAGENDFAQAATLYKRLLVLEPDCGDCWDRLGRVYDAWGKPDRAKEARAHLAH